MGTNFHTAWINRPTLGFTEFEATSMNPALASLDQGITYLKNIIIHCDGAVTYNPQTGVLTWASTLRILFNRSDGLAIQNTVAAGSLTLADNEFGYVNLSETNNAALTAAKAAVTTASASNFITYNRLVFGYRNTASNLYFPVYLNADRKATVSTTEETETTIDSFTLEAGKAYLLEARVVAKEGDSDRAAFVRRACVYRAVAGAATLQGSVQDALTIESDGDWDCTIDVSSNDARVRVTGDYESSISWACELKIMEV